MEIIADHIAKGTELYLACQYAGVPYATTIKWRKESDEFQAMLADAAERRTQSLEREAWRRAEAGSDTLMIFMLKAARPGTYRDNVSVELTGPNGAPLELGDSARAARILALLETAKHEALTIEHTAATDDIADAQYRDVIAPRADNSDLL